MKLLRFIKRRFCNDYKSIILTFSDEEIKIVKTYAKQHNLLFEEVIENILKDYIDNHKEIIK